MLRVRLGDPAPPGHALRDPCRTPGWRRTAAPVHGILVIGTPIKIHRGRHLINGLQRDLRHLVPGAVVPLARVQVMQRHRAGKCLAPLSRALVMGIVEVDRYLLDLQSLHQTHRPELGNDIGPQHSAREAARCTSLLLLCCRSGHDSACRFRRSRHEAVAETGLSHATPGNLAKSVSVETTVRPCSRASAARCASGTRFPAGRHSRTIPPSTC